MGKPAWYIYVPGLAWNKNHAEKNRMRAIG